MKSLHIAIYSFNLKCFFCDVICKLLFSVRNSYFLLNVAQLASHKIRLSCPERTVSLQFGKVGKSKSWLSNVPSHALRLLNRYRSKSFLLFRTFPSCMRIECSLEVAFYIARKDIYHHSSLS